MTKPDAERLEERAERIRDAFRKRPGFVEMLRASLQAEKEGRFVAHEEVVRKYGGED